MSRSSIKYLLFGITVAFFACCSSTTKEANVKNKDVQDSISRTKYIDNSVDVFGYQIRRDDSIYEQFLKICEEDEYLEMLDSSKIMSIVGVKFALNIHGNNFFLVSSKQPESPEIRKVIKHLTHIYGEPVEEGLWTSMFDSTENRKHQYYVKLRRVHSDEGGTILFFN